METTKKILKIALIIIIAIVLAFALLLALRVAKNEKGGSQTGYDSAGTMPMSIDAGRSMMGIENGEGMADFNMPNPALQESAAMPAQKGEVAARDVQVAEKKIIKDGYINAQVDNADNAARDISGIAKRLGGDVESMNFRKTAQNVKSGTIVVRVPFINFDTAFEEIKQVATLVRSESANAQDVTSQVADLEARLKNKQAEEESFQQILDNTNGKTEDVLMVTQELSRVRGEIEQLEAQKKYLASQTDMSTITANISEDVTVGTATSWRPWQIAKTEFASMLKDLQKLIGALIVIVVRLTPILLVFILFFLIVFWVVKAIIKSIFWKKKQKEMQQKTEEPITPAGPESIKKAPRTKTIAARRIISRKK